MSRILNLRHFVLSLIRSENRHGKIPVHHRPLNVVRAERTVLGAVPRAINNWKYVRASREKASAEMIPTYPQAPESRRTLNSRNILNSAVDLGVPGRLRAELRWCRLISAAGEFPGRSDAQTKIE
jgi:hypothetical protein